jgi:hypothetical protein
MTESDTIPGLEDLAAAAASRNSRVGVQQQSRRRGRAPSPRILNAGGTALRTVGVLLVIGGFYPFLWTVFEVIWLFQGGGSDLTFQVVGGTLSVHMEGWPAIIFGTIWSLAVWCCALIAFALGHAMYVLRDLAGQTAAR